MNYKINHYADGSITNIGVFDYDKFVKALEYIKSKMTQEDYAVLGSDEFQFDVHVYQKDVGEE